MKKIISGSQMMVVDPANLENRSVIGQGTVSTKDVYTNSLSVNDPDNIVICTNITPKQVKSTDILADEWVTAKNATITEGISAQNGTFSSKLEVGELDSMEDELPVKKRMRFEDPLQGDALNREEATVSIVTDVVLSCDNGEIKVKGMKMLFHRVTEYIVYIKAEEGFIAVSTANATAANSSTSCSHIINITPRDSYVFPTNISPTCNVTIPCVIQVGEKSSSNGPYEYDAYFCLNNGEMLFEMSNIGVNILEHIQGSDKTFTGFGVTGLTGFMPVPGVNSQTKYNTIFN